MLEDRARRALYAWSAFLCSASVALLPLSARSSLGAPAGDTALALPQIALTKAAQRPRPLVFTRDPFEPAVPDLASAATPGAVVRGVALGEHPQALVEDVGRVRLVELGSSVAGSRVTEIDQGGVVLENGTFLRLTGDRP
jgi:hypothetical protein